MDSLPSSDLGRGFFGYITVSSASTVIWIELCGAITASGRAAWGGPATL